MRQFPGPMGGYPYSSTANRAAQHAHGRKQFCGDLIGRQQHSFPRSELRFTRMRRICVRFHLQFLSALCCDIADHRVRNKGVPCRRMVALRTESERWR